MCARARVCVYVCMCACVKALKEVGSGASVCFCFLCVFFLHVLVPDSHRCCSVSSCFGWPFALTVSVSLQLFSVCLSLSPAVLCLSQSLSSCSLSVSVSLQLFSVCLSLSPAVLCLSQSLSSCSLSVLFQVAQLGVSLATTGAVCFVFFLFLISEL